MIVDLDALEAVLAKMTPGVWVSDGQWVEIPRGDISCFDDPCDADGIVALVNAAPALIARIRTLIARIRELEIQVKYLQSGNVERWNPDA